MKKTLFLATALLGSSLSLAQAAPALSLPGYFGSINNNTGYVLECSQVIGGYCANNPMPANGYIQMLPDPGSKEIRGHIMAFDKNKPGHYTGNILFKYAEQKNGNWAFQLQPLDKNIKVKSVMPDTILLNKVTKK